MELKAFEGKEGEGGTRVGPWPQEPRMFPVLLGRPFRASKLDFNHLETRMEPLRGAKVS